MKPIAVNGSVPIARKAKDVLLLFVLSGIWILAPGHAQCPVLFLTVTGSMGHLSGSRACTRPGTCQQHDVAVPECARSAGRTAPVLPGGLLR